MSNRIGNPPGPQTVSTPANQAADNIGSTTSSSASTSIPPKTEEHPQPDSKTTDALKKRGSEVKSQQHTTAGVVKHDLEKRLEKLPSKTITFERDAGNDKLAKIHVHRSVHTTQPKQKYATEEVGEQRIPDVHLAGVDDGSEIAFTKFPNGVGFKTDSYIDGNGKRGIRGISVEPPPGGKMVSTSNGGGVIYDKEGKKVGELHVELGEVGKEEPKVTLIVHSKEGEYKQTGDGQITFTPKTHNK